MELQPATFARGRDVFRERLGDPSTWAGDWRKCPNGRYLNAAEQRRVNELLATHDPMLVGMAIRGVNSKTLAAVFGVTRESIDRRLRPLGLKNAPGQVGRPAQRRSSPRPIAPPAG